jgi:hypothetical protein
MKDLGIKKQSGVELRTTKNGNFSLFYDGQWTSKRIASNLSNLLDRESISYESLAMIVSDSLSLINQYYSEELAENGVSYKENAIDDFYELIAEIVDHLFYDEDTEELWAWIKKNPNFIYDNEKIFRQAIIEGENKDFPFDDGEEKLMKIFS